MRQAPLVGGRGSAPPSIAAHWCGGHYTLFGASWQTTLTAPHFAGIVNGMSRQAIIRPFNGSLADARGLLAVEKATLDESPYNPEQVQAMLAGGPQQAWLAVAGDRVVGYVVGFATRNQRGPSWEIDLLAVHPDWAGRGLGTRLIRAASAYGARLVRRARAVVAADNVASMRAFRRAGFLPGAACNLLILRGKSLSAFVPPGLDVTVREADPAASMAESQPDAEQAPEAAGPLLLLAEQGGRPAGSAELVRVQTLLYRGVWIESLAAETDAARLVLAGETIRRAQSAGLDEVGMMVPESDRRAQETLLAAGFESLGEFRWFEARLPLPGLAACDNAPPPGEKRDASGHN